MIEDPHERLRLTLTGRDLTITISEGDEKRLRMWVDRMNADEAQRGCDLEPQDPDDDLTLVEAIVTCMGEGLRVDEQGHGLHAFEWGDVVSLEVAEEMQRERGML